MKRALLDILACPNCKGALTPTSVASIDCEIVMGGLACDRCDKSYPVTDGIPRFVDANNYADSFGFQWNVFSKTQLDSHSGLTISRERLFTSTGWDWSSMEDKRILDVGCGAGRFAEIALESGASVVGVDYSCAADAARNNLSRYPRFEAVQASIYELPFIPGSFDYVYCLGVLQHTPKPAMAFARLPEQVRRGGRIAVDVYPRMWTNVFWSKYWIRPITTRMPNEILFKLVQRAVPFLLGLSRLVSAIPLVGRKLKYLLPVANYGGVYGLSENQLREWAILDTFDMLSPEHDHPQSMSEIARWFADAGIENTEVFRKGHIIGRGSRAR